MVTVERDSVQNYVVSIISRVVVVHQHRRETHPTTVLSLSDSQVYRQLVVRFFQTVNGPSPMECFPSEGRS